MNRLYTAMGVQFTTDRRLVKNSEVIKIGDWITDEATGVANVDAVTEPILGLVVGVLDKYGNSVEAANSATLSTGSFATSTRTFTAGSDNQTVDLVMVEFIEARPSVRFVATLDADKGTTTGSNKAGYHVGILTSNSSLLDESTAAVGAVDGSTPPLVNAQFRIVKATGDTLGVREVVVEVVHSNYTANKS